MAYGNEVHDAPINYSVTLNHTPTNINVVITVTSYNSDGSTPAEATCDSIFQAFLTKVVTLGNATLISATKRGGFSQSVTTP